MVVVPRANQNTIFFWIHFEIQSTFLSFDIQLKQSFMLTQNRRLTGIVLTVLLLLLIPFIAMQFTTEVNWSVMDFVIMGILLLGTGLLCELVLRNVKSFEKRLLLIGTILLICFLIWAQLAVGLIGKLITGSL